jgi:hypothetical protein
MGNIASNEASSPKNVENTSENGGPAMSPILKPYEPQLGPSWSQVAPSWNKVGPSWNQVGPKLGPFWPNLTPSRADVAAMLDRNGAFGVGPICKMCKLPQSRALFAGLSPPKCTPL